MHSPAHDGPRPLERFPPPVSGGLLFPSPSALGGGQFGGEFLQFGRVLLGQVFSLAGVFLQVVELAIRLVAEFGAGVLIDAGTLATGDEFPIAHPDRKAAGLLDDVVAAGF